VKIDVENRGGVSIVRVTGQMRGEPDLAKTAIPLIEVRGARVIIDMNAVDFVGSAGLGELVRITAQANAQGARVVLAAVTPFVQGVLEMTQLHRFFETYSTVDEAVGTMA
jgi:anti-sigma B factor antagonist